MYDELVKALRETDFGDTCVLCEHDDMCKSNDCIIIQAADAIEELSEQVDNMNEENIALYGALPKWIPVSESLPSAHELVLVYNPGYLMSTGFMYEDGRWRVRSVDYPETPTHWMRLPEPPEELTGTDMRGGIRRDDAGDVIDWGITGPPGDVGKTEEAE